MLSTKTRSGFEQLYSQRRSSPRMPIHAGGSVRCSCLGETEHVALVRDVSSGGVFLYSDFNPPIGADLSLVFNVRDASDQRVFCQGRVVRVERASKLAAPGIAVKIDCQSIPLRNSA